MIVWSFFLLGSLAWLGAAHPIHSDAEEPQWMLRERRSPLAASSPPTCGGYHYERPERAFHPPAALAARKQDLVDEDPEAAQPERGYKSIKEPVEVEVAKAPAEPERKPKASKSPKPKAPKRRPTVDEDEEEDEDDEDRGSVYRNFFPMTFAGASMRSRNAEDGEEEGGRGPVAAIANSFSKGRGAIAHSSAVAHGNPDAGQSRRRQQNKNRAQEQTNVHQR